MKNMYRIILALIVANTWLSVSSSQNIDKNIRTSELDTNIELNFSYCDYEHNLILKICRDSIYLYCYSNPHGPIFLILNDKLPEWQKDNIQSLSEALPDNLLPYFFDNDVDDDFGRSIYINNRLIATIKGGRDEPCLKDLQTFDNYLLNLIPFDPFDEEWIYKEKDSVNIVSTNKFISLNE